MISAVVLAHNDEANLSRTLESLTWCDETVVVDDNSADATPEIAKQFGCRYFRRALGDDFAAQRNYGLGKAKHSWVLFVDSDEIVTDDLRKEITERLKSGSSAVQGYFLRRRDYMFGRFLEHGETGGVRLLRLARRDAGIWKRRVHEVWDVSGTTEELARPLLHFPHSNVAQFLKEIDYYSSLNAKLLLESKTSVPPWHIVAYPAAKFFVNYVWRLGFLDGTPGAIVALSMSFHSFLTRAKAYLQMTRHEA